MTFTAIDFETATPTRNSICQVGLVRIEGGQVAHTINQLVRPPDNLYHKRCIAIHGITAPDTADAPSFAELWPELLPFIKGQTVVAHNSAFDFSCLQRTLEHYVLPFPFFTGACTYKLTRMALNKACEFHKIPLNHHDALSDARACAELYLLRSSIV